MTHLCKCSLSRFVHVWPKSLQKVLFPKYFQYGYQKTQTFCQTWIRINYIFQFGFRTSKVLKSFHPNGHCSNKCARVNLGGSCWHPHSPLVLEGKAASRWGPALPVLSTSAMPHHWPLSGLLLSTDNVRNQRIRMVRIIQSKLWFKTLYM